MAMFKFGTNFLVLLVVILLGSCSTAKEFEFACHEWDVDLYHGTVMSRDSAYRLGLSANHLMSPPTIISSKMQINKYNGADKYLSHILGEFPVAIDSVLCYIPEFGIVHTILAKDSSISFKPKSVTSPIGSRNPYTAWVRDDDEEEWKRQHDEMYSNTLLVKKHKQILVLDRYSYGEDEIGTIYVIQTQTKGYTKTRLPENFCGLHDVTKPENLEIVANWIDGHRRLSLIGARSGLFPMALPDSLQSGAVYQSLIGKADSCYMAQDYAGASNYFSRAFRHARHIQGHHLYNAACAASLAKRTNTALNYLYRRADSDPSWYSDNLTTDKDLFALHGDPRWSCLVKILWERKSVVEKDYDLELKAQLEQIAKSDQAIRYEYLAALNIQQKDSVTIDSLATRMRSIDKSNLYRINAIVKKYGWPSRKVVGDANQAIWLVVQHSDLATIKRYLPIFRKAVELGELRPDFVAMMEDRCNIWSGNKQKYGTQGETDANGKFTVRLETLLDFGKVDQWRKEVGLPPLEEYIMQMNSAARSGS